MAIEINLLSTNGLPEDSIVSVRAGTARRQAPANSGKALRFPKLGMQENPVKIDILKPVATAHMVLMPGETQYKVVFPGNIICELEVKPTDHTEVGCLALDTTAADVAEDQARTGTGSAKEAKDYLERHQILPFIQALLQVVSKERPLDPYKYMARHFMGGYGPLDTCAARQGGDVREPAEPEEADAALAKPQAASAPSIQAAEEPVAEVSPPSSKAARQEEAARRQERALLEATRREATRRFSRAREARVRRRCGRRFAGLGSDLGELEEPLRKGWVKLVRASWLVDLYHCGGVLCRRQDLPEEAFVSLEQLTAEGGGFMQVGNGGLEWFRIIVLSYPWLQPGHPDPHGENLRVIAEALECYIGHDGAGESYGVLIDFTALFQVERTEEENELFKLALPALNLFYAHPMTVVLKVTRFPDGYPNDDEHRYILPVGANTVEYGERGWCFAESAMSGLVKSDSLVIDLGRLDGRVRTLEELMTRGKSGRAAPLHPDDFEAALSSKTFTSRRADFDKVAKLYSDAFEHRFCSARVLGYSGLKWDAVEVQRLARALQRNSLLEKLNLRHNRAGDEGAEALGRALQGMTSLQELDLKGNEIGDKGGKALGNALLHHTSLRQLYLGGNKIWSEGVVALAQHPSVQCLDLEQNQIGNVGAVAIGEGLQHSSSLRELRLSSNEIGNEGAVALGEGLQRSTSLRKLLLSSNEIGNEGATALGEALQHCTSLETLHLQHNEIGHEGAAVLGEALQHNTSLDWLDLRHNRIGNKGAAALGEALQHNASLQRLYVESNAICDEGAVALGGALQHNTSLRCLHLGFNAIGDEGAEALWEALQHNTSLSLLGLRQNKISDARAAALREAKRITLC